MSLEPHFGHGAACFTGSIFSDIPDLYLRSLTVRRITCVVDIFLNKGYKRYLGPFLQALFQGSKRRAGFVLLVILAGAYGWMFLSGPQGLQSLFEKRREIRELEERNANIRLENDRRKERIRRLEESRSEQEMEIRKQLKLQRPGETTFILPESEQKDKVPPSPE
jgi:cell division protein FtsB